MTGNSVLTIGHSNHTAEGFIALLRQHRADAIADVRSVPYSRWQPQFNRESLAGALQENGIAYVFLGEELGARSDDPACYEGGRVQYRRLAKTSLFRAGIERLLNGSQRYRIALMCAEKEPLECHRTILVSRELVASGKDVAHIHADGSLESHDEALGRLLQLHGLPKQDLFRSQSEFVSKAYEKQEERIAFVAGERNRNQEEI